MTRARAEHMEYERPVIIGVIGGRRPAAEEMEMAEAVGRKIAELGATLICGGCRGVMEAACRGAKAGGGLTIGVLPGHDRDAANPFVDLPIVTGIGEARNSIIARTAQAVVAIGGSYGTLTEIAYSIAFGTPVVGLGTWHIEREGHAPPPILLYNAFVCCGQRDHNRCTLNLFLVVRRRGQVKPTVSLCYSHHVMLGRAIVIADIIKAMTVTVIETTIRVTLLLASSLMLSTVSFNTTDFGNGGCLPHS